jgi:5-methylcytosine-specific restriction endonuclease McrA
MGTGVPFDPEHAVPRSRGGGDTVDNVWLACRPCHEQKSVPYAKGRLIVTPLGGGRFRFEVVVKRDKWA